MGRGRGWRQKMMYERVGDTKRESGRYKKRERERERERDDRENLMNWVVNQISKTC
jgi:hypothetical protein